MDRFSRSRLLLGDAALKRLEESRVIVVGLGAVGGYAVEGLARSGVGSLMLIDFDTVCPTNINRQLYALESTVGKRKTEVAAARVRDINPRCRVETKSVFVDAENVAEVLATSPQLVVDAIDSLGPKVSLLAECWRRDVPVVSSMGAARRRDPTRIVVGDIFDTTECPLARQIRRRLKRMGVGRGIRCVYSTERVGTEGLGPEESQSGDRGRPRRTLGSLPPITGIFGLTLAALGIEVLLGEPASWSSGGSPRRKADVDDAPGGDST
jgi:tRNA threonylcarbamoyladenosine dehydratase